MRRPSWLVCIATDTVTRQWCGTVHLRMLVACSPTLEESYRKATTPGPIIERGLTQISRAGIPKRPLPNCQAGPTASSTPLFQDAQMPWGGHP